MLNLLNHLEELSRGSRDRLVLEATLRSYLEQGLHVVSLRELQLLPEPLRAACDWGASLSHDDFYRQLAAALERTGTIDLPELGLNGRHSLSWRDSTWLLLWHEQFGDVAVLQRNFSCEAVLFADLHLFLIRREGRLQEQILHQMLRNVLLRQEAVKTYLKSLPTFGGINFTFPNPFHTINYGHTALYRLAQDPLLLRTKVWVDPANAWFDPSVAFPTVVAGLCAVPTPCPTFIELTTPEPIFLFKPAHVYRKHEEPLNRQVELALLAASGAAQPRPAAGFRLWLGLTSGKRSLVNERSLMAALVELLVKNRHLNEVIIDGWTGSSMKDAVMEEAPPGYSSHAEEFEQMRGAILERAPQVTIRSLIGRNYEEKLQEALGCGFFCSSAYTASILPSRFCAMGGVVHTSNRGLPHLRMHIHRRSLFVPKELVFDEPFEEGLHPLDTSYRVAEEPFLRWVEQVISDH
jgi:hypothetical protein